MLDAWFVLLRQSNGCGKKREDITKILSYIFVIFGGVLLYEVIRAVVKEQIVLRVSRSALHYINENRIKLDRFKFMSKFIVKKDLMNDMDIHKAMLEHAKEKGIRIDAAEKLVEDYIEEIVPFFNLLSYYKFGWWVANTLLNFLYEVLIDHENAEKLKKFLTFYRRYRENLYHTVLEKYIQLISIQGVTQGIFIEGGLTRDGRFRDTKVGVIDYIMKIKKNPEFRGDVIFVPVGINYDWVLEDRTLIDEWKRGKEKSGLKGNVVSFSRIVVKIPYLFIGNTLRWMTGRLKHHGYASVSFGQPISASEFINQKEKNFFTRERYDRLGVIKQFADWLLYNIGEVIPVTPVCLIALALELLQKELLTYDELVHKVALLKAKMKNDGRRIVIGKAFQSTTEGFRKLENEEFHRKKELVSFEKELLDIDEAKTMTDVACDLLQRRRIVNMKNGIIKINKSKKSLIQYYANSLIHLVQ